MLLGFYNTLTPMPPYVLARMLLIAHAISVLPRLSSPAGGPSDNGSSLGGTVASPSSYSSSSSSSPSSNSHPAAAPHSLYLAVNEAAASSGGCAAVAAAAARPHELARVRRELDCAFREVDEARHRVVNEVTHLMQVGERGR